MKRTLFLLVLLIPLPGYSQQKYLTLESGWAGYAMTDMKTFQSDFINSSGITIKPVTSFPAYVGYGVSIGRENKLNSFGISLGYNATGGRADYEDYSGIARMDQQLKSFSFRITFKRKLNTSAKWPVYFSLSPALVLTHMGITTLSVLGASSNSSSLSFDSRNIGIQPSVIVQRNVARNFFIQWNAGYEIQLSGKLYLSGNHSQYIANSGGPLKADWSGFRIGMGVGLYPWKKNSDEFK